MCDSIHSQLYLEEAPELTTLPTLTPPSGTPSVPERWTKNKATLRTFSTDVPWDAFQALALVEFSRCVLVVVVCW